MACLLSASAAAGWADDRTVVIAGGPVKLGVTRPAPEDLSSGASLDLSLPVGSMKAQASTSVGREEDNPAIWQKNAAQVDAQVSGPMGSRLAVTGQDTFGFTYRAPNSNGSSDAAGHMIRTESRSANASVTLPVGSARLTVGGAGSLTTTQDTDKSLPSGDRAIVSTEDQTLFAKAGWQPLPGVHVEGGAAAHVSDIGWREQRTRSSTFRSLDPHVSASVTPWADATVTARLEHKVSPYDSSAFADYVAANPTAAGPSFEPDHAWQLEMQLQQKVGPASVSATYASAHNGTVTEFADHNGTQVPAATRLEKRENVAVSLNLPLSPLGLPNTDFSSQAEWRDSEVVDPLTQKLRTASGEAPQTFSLRMAHRLPNEKLSFGVTGEFTGARTSYQVNQINSAESGGSLGAFLSFKPGPYELDLNVNGLYGGDSRSTFYSGSRATSQIGRTVVQDSGGALVNLSLHKAL